MSEEVVLDVSGPKQLRLTHLLPITNDEGCQGAGEPRPQDSGVALGWSRTPGFQEGPKIQQLQSRRGGGGPGSTPGPRLGLGIGGEREGGHWFPFTRVDVRGRVGEGQAQRAGAWEPFPLSHSVELCHSHAPRPPPTPPLVCTSSALAKGTWGKKLQEQKPPNRMVPQERKD